MSWKPATEPPKGEMGKWTEEVVVITNYGSVFLLAYFHGEDGGCWQRRRGLSAGEHLAWWVETPPPG